MSSSPCFCRRTAWKPNRFHRADAHPRTLASSTFNAYFDICVSCLILVVVSLACFLHYPATTHWVLLFLVFASYQFLVMVICFKQLWNHSKRRTTLSR